MGNVVEVASTLPGHKFGHVRKSLYHYPPPVGICFAIWKYFEYALEHFVHVSKGLCTHSVALNAPIYQWNIKFELIGGIDNSIILPFHVQNVKHGVHSAIEYDAQ